MANKEDVERARQGYEVWNAWAKREIEAGRHAAVDFSDINVEWSFEHFVFPGFVDFRRARFNGDASFSQAQFVGRADFANTFFERKAQFTWAEFHRDALFSQARFQGQATFGSVTGFIGAEFVSASFRRVRFMGNAHFNGIRCSDSMKFEAASFESGANFRAASFADAVFASCTFQTRARFREARFGELVDFSRAKFLDDLEFSYTDTGEFADFNSATFAGSLELDNASVRGLLNLMSVKLSRPVRVHTVELDYAGPKKGAGFWPWFLSISRYPIAAEAYRRLKQLASENKDHEAELRFFALEMRAKRFHESHSVAIIPSLFYDWFSDYGCSIARPALWLLAVWLGATVATISAHAGTIAAAGKMVLPAIAIAVSNSALLVGSDKWALRADAFEALDQLCQCSSKFSLGLNLLAYFQSGVCLLLLFLIGLGLRNRFRVGSTGT